MGRAGVTLLDVEKAALQLQGRGKNPSVDAVREILGTGSKSTIAQHLRDLRAQQSQASGKLPQELLALVTGLWERLNLQADQRISEIESNYTEEAAQLKQTLIQLQQEHTQVKKQLHISEEKQFTELSTKEKLEQDLRKLNQEQAKLQERYQATMNQLEDQKKENGRLHQLANNIQANLEHYQNAMQKLRMEQSLATEKQQHQTQQELSTLQHKLSSQLLQAQKHSDQLNKKTLEIEQIIKQHQLLQEAHQILTQRDQKNSHELIALHERCYQNQKALSSSKEDINSKNKQILALEKQVTILDEQKSQVQRSLDQMKNKIEALRHEKIFLIQEKSELQGHLKQLERIK